MLQSSNYSLVLLFDNSFSELLPTAPVIQLILVTLQDAAILNIIILCLMFFNTFVFQAGLVSLLLHKFKGTILLTVVYSALSISLHIWVMNLCWKNCDRFVWIDGLQTLFQRPATLLYCYFHNWVAVHLGDLRFRVPAR
ncbi:transmembrane protein 138-like [Tenrec ecaudatus]|uniref:transmembrane protein 138-like n=1 Tax=Tenrec ecaudatus TaxID=94439 RepID=UPI003F597F24